MNKQDYFPMNAAELMDRVFDLYKKSFWMQIGYSVLIGAISFVLIAVASVAITAVVIVANGDVSDAAFLPIVLGVAALILPLYFVWKYAADTGHILITRQAFYNRKQILPFREMFAVLLRVLGVALAQLILSLPWIILFGAAIFFVWQPNTGGPTVIFYEYMDWLSSSAFVIISIVATLAYVVYSNIFSLAVPVAVFEKRTFFSAVVRSYRLIKGEFWKILGVRILWSIVVTLISYSAQGLWFTAKALIEVLSGSVLGETPYMMAAGSILQSAVTLIIAFLIGPMGGILTALIYFNQKIKKEGLDIEIGLEQLYKRL